MMYNGNMKLYLQDPTYEFTKPLEKTIKENFAIAQGGAGAYAFATKEGIDRILGSAEFKKLMKKGTWEIIVGTDDITDVRTLKALQRFEEKFKPQLIAQVYIHQDIGSIFHPKYSWFEQEKGGTLVIGSGNLTKRGVRNNREAYTVVPLDEDALMQVKKEWTRWTNHSKDCLYTVQDAIDILKSDQRTFLSRVLGKIKNLLYPKVKV